MQDESGTVYIPLSTWPISYKYDEPENVLVRANSTDDMTAAGKKTADIMNSYISPTDDTIKYQSKDLLEQAQQLQQLSSSTNSMLIWIAAISLLVGGIGVMNIMLVSVTERTAEIGLKKAIGARKGKIMGQFLTEAAVLTSMGGVLGVASGIGLAQIISIMSGTPVAISWPAAFIAVVFSMVIGIVFGILPSHQAANLNPIDALRTN
jgi:putative ABC transport system permease protein